MTVSLRWLGGAGFTLRVGRHMLALDPCLGPLSDQLRLGLALPWCDCILVSGSSREKLADVQVVARRTGAVVAAPPAVCRSLALLGVPARQVRPMSPGSTLPVAGFAIEALWARHSERCLGFRVRAGLISLLTDPRAATWSPGIRADIVLAGPRERRASLARVLRAARPRLVVACRQGTAWEQAPRDARPGAGERRVASAIRAAGVPARIFVPEILRENDLRGLL